MIAYGRGKWAVSQKPKLIPFLRLPRRLKNGEIKNLLQIPALYNSHAQRRPINLNGKRRINRLGCRGDNFLELYQAVKFTYLGFVWNLFFCSVVAESPTQIKYLLSLSSIF